MDNVYQKCPPKMSDGRFLTDYRSTAAREEYLKTINGFTRDDDYRHYLQSNATKIIDREWNTLKSLKSCRPTTCVHTYPTRVSNGELHDEMLMYNNVRTRRIKPGDANYPICQDMPDYRMMY